MARVKQSLSAVGLTRDTPNASDLLDLFQPPAWQADAACKEHPELTWHPNKGENATAAKAVCAGCLVRGECLAFALDLSDQHGIWGGLSRRERASLVADAEHSAA